MSGGGGLEEKRRWREQNAAFDIHTLITNGMEKKIEGREETVRSGGVLGGEEREKRPSFSRYNLSLLLLLSFWGWNPKVVDVVMVFFEFEK
ncbi:unnamed protein product [Sphenostylis stenocarpa]|uniref:Uncharacterized protein n=1 Tax=Sphenostylis stenocarpa TaxID=92480 RepID=A0AA86VU47_9FABA|nr:unnamed protein product [Sphenostylis stenocarpa]